MPHLWMIGVMGAVALTCASPGRLPVVQSEYLPDENFATYRRYGWLPSDVHLGGQMETRDHYLHHLIRVAIDERLAEKGYSRIRVEDADFLVTYHCKIDEELQVDVIDRVYYDSAWDHGGWEEVTRRIELRTFEQGSIVIDLVNSSSGQRVWRGVARGRISSEASSEQLREIVDRSVREILDEFPPG